MVAEHGVEDLANARMAFSYRAIFIEQQFCTCTNIFHLRVTTKLDENQKSWGFVNFMPLVELNDAQKGFIVKNACVVGVGVSVTEVANEKEVSPGAAVSQNGISRGGRLRNSKHANLEDNTQQQRKVEEERVEEESDVDYDDELMMIKQSNYCTVIQVVYFYY